MPRSSLAKTSTATIRPRIKTCMRTFLQKTRANGSPDLKRKMPRSDKEPSMAKKRSSPLKPHKPSAEGSVRLYTLEIFIISGPVTEKFAKKNPVISRTIQIRGDQFLQDLHHAIFDAYGRF